MALDEPYMSERLTPRYRKRVRVTVVCGDHFAATLWRSMNGGTP